MKFIFWLFILLSAAFLFADELPEWVIEIPEITGIKFAVGFSNVFSDSVLAERNAFLCGCYFLSLQDKVSVKSVYYENSSRHNPVYHRIVLADSLKQSYYEDTAEIIGRYSDERYYYVLVSTGKAACSDKIISYNAAEIPLTLEAKADEYIGYGIVNLHKAEGFLHATWQAYQSLGSQLQMDIKHLYSSGKHTVIISESLSEISILETRIIGYYVDFRRNMIICNVSYRIHH
jgi:hypothetical protein